MGRYEVRIGDCGDLNRAPPADVVAVCSCIHKTKGEQIRHEKPFIGLGISEFRSIKPEQFDLGVNFIDKYIPLGNVMVACEEGLCRSVSVGIAYYCNSEGMSLDEAKKKVGGYPRCSAHEGSLIRYVNPNGHSGKRGFVERAFGWL